MLFAHLKRILRLDRLRLRGPSGAKDDEFLLAATPKIRGNSRSSSPSRRKSSLHKAEGSNPSALIAVATAVRSHQPRAFFNIG
jgi:hypothetical protein